MRWDELSGLRRQYREQGHVMLSELVDADVASAVVGQVMAAAHADHSLLRRPPENVGATRGPVRQVGGHRYPPLATFHWGLTPIITAVTGVDLAPSYCIFRVNTRRSELTPHRDRQASEHALSLTLAYSEHAPWPFEIGAEPIAQDFQPGQDWGDLPHRSLSMTIGDAVLYRGAQYAHARTTPNPNGTSAHALLFWVDRDGPHADWRFDRRAIPAEAVTAEDCD